MNVGGYVMLSMPGFNALYYGPHSPWHKKGIFEQAVRARKSGKLVLITDTAYTGANMGPCVALSCGDPYDDGTGAIVIKFAAMLPTQEGDFMNTQLIIGADDNVNVPGIE